MDRTRDSEVALNPLSDLSDVSSEIFRAVELAQKTTALEIGLSCGKIPPREIETLWEHQETLRYTLNSLWKTNPDESTRTLLQRLQRVANPIRHSEGR